MKNLKIMAIAVFVASIGIVSSCSKYEDGPKLTLRTKKARLVGKWELKEYVDEDGNTHEATDSEHMTLQRDGDHTIVDNGYSYSGKWDLSNDKKHLKISLTPASTVSMKIYRLTNKELWLEGPHIVNHYEAK